MNRIIKIVIWVAFLFYFIFVGIVWTKPLTTEQTQNDYNSAVSQNHIDNTTQSIEWIAQQIKDTKAPEEAKYQKNIEPASLFLFGSGMIGLGIIARRKI